MSGPAPRADQRPFTIRRTIEAPAAAVFGAWFDPDAVSRWFEAGRNWSAPRAAISIDPRPGGEWLVTEVDPSRIEHPTVFVYHEIEPPSRLVFAATSPGRSGDSQQALATVSLIQLGAHTEMLFQAWADEAEVAEVASSWSKRLDHLAREFAQPKHTNGNP